MINVKQAKQMMKKNIPFLGSEMKSLKGVLGYILAQDIHAPFSLPLWDNSAMDGFALRSRDTKQAKLGKPILIKILGTIKAGDEPKRLSMQGSYRIMTGAAVPEGADTVIPKEEAVIQDGFLLIDRFIPTGCHIRYRGEEVKKGIRVLKKHALINPGTIGVLASLGKDWVEVFKKPIVS